MKKANEFRVPETMEETKLMNKVDFIALILVDRANPNGSPTEGGMPRIDAENYGEISGVCLKHKIRYRLLDLGEKVYIVSADRSDDGCTSLAERAKKMIGDGKQSELRQKACELYADVRDFGALFAFKEAMGGEAVSTGIKGAVTIRDAVSVAPVEIESYQITKCVNGEPPKKGKKDAESEVDCEDGCGKKMSSDRMGMRHQVIHGLYVMRGSISPQIAAKNGMTEHDVAMLKEAIRTMFVNDESAARPAGSMEVVRLFWAEHNSPIGQYSSAEVHRSVSVTVREGVDMPRSLDDYVIEYKPLEGLHMEEIKGL